MDQILNRMFTFATRRTSLYAIFFLLGNKGRGRHCIRSTGYLNMNVSHQHFVGTKTVKRTLTLKSIQRRLLEHTIHARSNMSKTAGPKHKKTENRQ